MSVFFLSALIVIGVLVAGFLLFGLLVALRRQKMDPSKTDVEPPRMGEDAPRPEHLRVTDEQHGGFAGKR